MSNTDSQEEQDEKQDLKLYSKTVVKDLVKNKVKEKLKSRFKKQIRNKILIFIFTNPITYIIIGVLLLAILIYALVNNHNSVEIPIVDVCEQRNLEPAACKKALEDEQLDKWLKRGNI